MGGFLQNNLGLVIAGGIMLVAALVLAAIGMSMRNAGMSLRPVVFVGVFFAIICMPQLLGHAAMAVWPKAKPALDEKAIAGVDAFARPELIFGSIALDESNHRVKVLEYVASRESPSAAYNWKLQRGITFFRKRPGIDLQQTTGPLIRAVTDAGWSWQPLLFDAPGPLAWFVS